MKTRSKRKAPPKARAAVHEEDSEDEATARALRAG